MNAGLNLLAVILEQCSLAMQRDFRRQDTSFQFASLNGMYLVIGILSPIIETQSQNTGPGLVMGLGSCGIGVPMVAADILG